MRDPASPRIISIMRTLCLILALILTACDSAPQDVLPTVAELPSLTATPLALDSATLESTWTPTFTETATPTPGITDTPTVTPSMTITDTPTPTATATASPTADQPALADLLQLALEATILPVTVAVPPSSGDALPLPLTAAPMACAMSPTGGFATFFNSDTTLSQQLGCPQGDPLTVGGAWQEFEGGWMLWLDGPIYALYNSGQFERFEDTFDSAIDPESGGETPPVGRVEPVRGFGKVWRTHPSVRQFLGWAFGDEAGGQITYQRFDRGLMLAISARTQIIVLAGSFDGTWRSFVGSF